MADPLVRDRYRYLAIEPQSPFAPIALGHLDADAKEFSVRLTRQEVKDSPDVDTDKPVSRQMEGCIYDYFGWSPYWGTGFYMGGYGFMRPRSRSRRRLAVGSATTGSPARRPTSTQRHRRYWVSYSCPGRRNRPRRGFPGGGRRLSIRYLIVDTKNWWPGKSVLFRRSWRSRSIGWTGSLIWMPRARASRAHPPTMRRQWSIVPMNELSWPLRE